MVILLAVLIVSAAVSAAMLHRFDRVALGAGLGLVLGPFGVLAAAVMRASLKAAEQQRATDARLAAMLRATTAAAKKPAPAGQGAPQGAAPAAAVGAASAQAPREERECPFCAEKILRKARVCKHCGRDVEPQL
jgi:hypothetical protein